MPSTPLFDTSTKDLFSDLPSPYADAANAHSPYADVANADSPYDHDHERGDYDHDASPYADKHNAESPYDLDEEKHRFDLDQDKHRFDLDQEKHRFDLDQEKHGYDLDEDKHRFDLDQEKHGYDADPVASVYDPDGAPMSAFEIDDEIKRVMRQEGRFSAIQRYRKLTGAGLNEARTAVDSLMNTSRPQAMGTAMTAADDKSNNGMRFIWFVVGLSFVGWLMENC